MRRRVEEEGREGESRRRVGKESREGGWSRRRVGREHSGDTRCGKGLRTRGPMSGELGDRGEAVLAPQ
jgi:hypothetical protein